MPEESYRECPKCKSKMKWKFVKRVFECTNCEFEESEFELVEKKLKAGVYL